jgi:hypothetical protein
MVGDDFSTEDMRLARGRRFDTDGYLEGFGVENRL